MLPTYSRAELVSTEQQNSPEISADACAYVFGLCQVVWEAQASDEHSRIAHHDCRRPSDGRGRAVDPERRVSKVRQPRSSFASIFRRHRSGTRCA